MANILSQYFQPQTSLTIVGERGGHKKKGAQRRPFLGYLFTLTYHALFHAYLG